MNSVPVHAMDLPNPPSGAERQHDLPSPAGGTHRDLPNRSAIMKDRNLRYASGAKRQHDLQNFIELCTRQLTWILPQELARTTAEYAAPHPHFVYALDRA